MNPDDAFASTSPGPVSAQADHASGGSLSSKNVGPFAGWSAGIWVVALAIGLAAGMSAWAISETAMIPDSGHARRRGNVDPVASEVGLRNAMVSFGAFGAALGFCLGLAGGLICRSASRAVLAAATGSMLGGATGAGIARLLVPLYYKHLSADDLTYSLIVHCGTWGAVGAVTGAAFGLGLGRRDRLASMALGGMGAALLAAVCYELAGGILFPLAMTNQPVSATWQTRLASQLLVAVLTAIGVVLSAASSRNALGTGVAKP